MNVALDKYVLRPVAKGYNYVTPVPIKRGIHNFVTNLAYPDTIINLALQGKFKQSLIGAGRFLVNTFVGVGGLFDVATKEGIPLYNEDMGQTLAHWGYKNSNYIMLPIFGPSTMRDGFGRLTDNYTNPVNYLAWQEHVWGPYLFNALDVRALFLSQDVSLENVPDQYSLIRDAWLQRREFLIYDGNPPEIDYDKLLEDFEE